MLALINRLLDWFRTIFWKEEMELTLVGLQYSGKTTFVNVIAVSRQRSASFRAEAAEPEGSVLFTCCSKGSGSGCYVRVVVPNVQAGGGRRRGGGT